MNEYSSTKHVYALPDGATADTIIVLIRYGKHLYIEKSFYFHQLFLIIHQIHCNKASIIVLLQIIQF